MTTKAPIKRGFFIMRKEDDYYKRRRSILLLKDVVILCENIQSSNGINRKIYNLKLAVILKILLEGRSRGRRYKRITHTERIEMAKEAYHLFKAIQIKGSTSLGMRYYKILRRL